MFVLTLDSYLKAYAEVYKTPHIAFQCGRVLTIFFLYEQISLDEK